MSDLNEWQLAYSGISPFTFGTLASDYPFQSQVDITEADGVFQDSDHPNSDGTVMGIDRLGGRTLTFDCKVPPEYWRVVEGDKWAAPMDLFNVFAARWRADSIRRKVGTYATLVNVNRSRLVFGRPRKCAPKYERARKGEVSWVADFRTVDPNFYSAEEYYLDIGAGDVVSNSALSSGFVGGALQPGGTKQTWEQSEVHPGELETWVVVEFGGPGTVTCLTMGGTPIWELTSSQGNVNVDTRPWSRSVRTTGGGPANGYVSGKRIDLCKIPPGAFKLRFKGNGTTRVKWREAYAAL